MNDRQLKTFICVAEQKSFSKAAALSYISTPALVSQINTLERDLGVSLFVRSTHGIEITREGELFLETARQVLQFYDDAVEQSERLTQQTLLHIVLQPQNTAKFRNFMMKYQIVHPGITLRIDEMDANQLENALADGQVQIAYGPEPAHMDQQLEFTATSEHVFHVTVRGDHPLAGKDYITVADLQPYKVSTYGCSAWNVNPVDVLKASGVKVEKLEETLTASVLANKLFENAVLLTAGDMPETDPELIRTIPTDISAGKFGFMTSKDATVETKDFVGAYTVECEQR